MQRLLLALILLACALAVPAEPAFKEGVHYDLVTPAVATADPDRIEVVELFWYGCPHCYHLEPVITEWAKKKPEDVDFRHQPAVFASNWVPHARAFYAAEALGQLDRLHKPLFDALHAQERPIMSETSLIAFAAEQGIPEEAFRDTYGGFDVDRKVRAVMQATRDYGITGVPSVIVNGKYRTTVTKAGGPDRLLKLVDFLVDKERKR